MGTGWVMGTVTSKGPMLSESIRPPGKPELAMMEGRPEKQDKYEDIKWGWQ